MTMFLSVLSIELSKIFSKGRSYIGFGAITILVPIVQAAMYSEGEAYFSLFTQGLQQQFSFTGTFLNGYLIAFIVLQTFARGFSCGRYARRRSNKWYL